MSAEAGRKFSLNQTGNGFYIEPQAQLTYSHQDSTGIHASNGLKIDLGSYDSTIGRAGTLIGYETTTGDSQINVYLKTGFVREFQGNTDYKLNGSREAHSFKGNWWNNGLGISANISKNIPCMQRLTAQPATGLISTRLTADTVSAFNL